MTIETDPKLQKRELRRLMRERRAEAFAKNPNAANAFRDVFLKTIALPAGACVSGYVACDTELDLAPLLHELVKRGHKLCLPISVDKDKPLRFRAYAPGDKLITIGKLAIPEPDQNAAFVEPDVVLVPLLAFDARGNRIGQGAGYYDRTLTLLRKTREILAIGVAFDVQRTDVIPVEPHDAVLDKIVTETQLIGS